MHPSQQPWIVRYDRTDEWELQLIAIEALPIAHLNHVGKRAVYEISAPAHEPCPICGIPDMRIQECYLRCDVRDRALMIYDLIVNAKRKPWLFDDAMRSA